jgi:hypothetical protein
VCSSDLSMRSHVRYGPMWAVMPLSMHGHFKA